MLDQQKEALQKIFAGALEKLGAADAPVTLERPKDPTHGDVACTCAMQLARRLRKNPRAIAEEIVSLVKADPAFAETIETIEIAGPGFINVRVAQGARLAIISDVLTKGVHFGESAENAGKSVLLEYVSANPTGPLHLGHARQGALGDVLANLLASQGWTVSREFYYNDAGVQIGNLANSVQIRCRQLQGESVELPENAYHGEYIVSIARDFLDRKPVHPHAGGVIESSGDFSDTDLVRRYSVAYLRNEQDDDLSALGVRFDNFFLESSLYSTGAVQKTVQAIIDSGKTYEADGALWLKTTEFEDLGNGLTDDKDRVMKKADGTYTYFVPDVAYHLNKFSRGYTKAVNIQGTDHHGTVARVRAGLQAASGVLGIEIPKTFPEYILHKMLSVVMDGEPVKMSKRSGNYVTLRDLVDWAGRDAARFFLVSRKADAEFVFDVTLARAKSDENPVYYLQYAHARICSVFANAAEQGYTVPDAAALAKCDLSPLSSKACEALVGAIAEYPQTLRIAARDHAPHVLCYYLKDLAAAFHAFYNAERVVVEDETVRNARLALLAAARQVLGNGLGLLGISAPQRMSRREETDGTDGTC
ncbi:arginine--tRNA ligase [Sutterella sp.]|uniref:arginine--tRNA ligase n=1 Tax=Sutterella sp. TaxID=1981025 RepID=UPI0026DF6CC9|nr:arginine--tRNA ligase [Sutterella sp.]MDO5530501.1 arginine--tRNA ligase [Sutterella sp.]